MTETPPSARASRTHWNSRIGFILAAAGSAIGLGAIWKFPYVASKNGGGAFLLVFIGFTFTLGIVLMMAEMAVGRASNSSPVGAYRRLGGKHWRTVGYMGVLAGFLILSFYSVVGGWTLAYVVKAASGSVIHDNPKLLDQIFSAFITAPIEPILYHALFMALTATVVLFGVQKGIENLSKFLMPALFIIMLVLIARSLTLPGALNGLTYFLTPDFSKITGGVIISALGLSFFTLSLGMGAMITYGSYVGEETSIPGAAAWVVGLTTLTCVLAGFMVLPAVFAFGFDPAAGPGLTFITMPAIFSKMVGGQWFAVAFFFLLLVAALTSSVSLMEVVTSFLIDEFGVARIPATVVMAVLMFALGIPASLSLGIWSDYTFFGKGIFDLLDYSTEKILMPIGGVMVSVLVGWKVWHQIHDELHHRGMPLRGIGAIRFACRYVAPILVTCVLFYNL
ncbi:MAG: sodium-dependent transporter [Oxalobacter sp.]|nr:MAG: sodium-dependent transporter [Oxalobacter sp.]